MPKPWNVMMVAGVSLMLISPAVASWQGDGPYCDDAAYQRAERGERPRCPCEERDGRDVGGPEDGCREARPPSRVPEGSTSSTTPPTTSTPPVTAPPHMDPPPLATTPQNPPVPTIIGDPAVLGTKVVVPPKRLQIDREPHHALPRTGGKGPLSWAGWALGLGGMAVIAGAKKKT